jgi:hypothetical protein
MTSVDKKSRRPTVFEIKVSKYQKTKKPKKKKKSIVVVICFYFISRMSLNCSVMTERRLGKQQQVTFPFLRIAEKGGNININRNGLMSPSCSISPLGLHTE